MKANGYEEVLTMQNSRRLLNVLLLLGVLLSWCAPQTTLFALPASATDAAGSRRVTLPERADAILVKIADLCQNQAQAIARHLNAGTHVRLNIGQGFYDKNLRRLFIAFEGAATFTGKLPFKLDTADRYFTSDNDIAWDFAIDQVRQQGRVISFRFHGDVVVFLDRLVYDLSKEMIDLAGGLAFRAAGDVMIQFLEKLNGKLMAEAITKTFASFSKESLSTTGAELLSNSIQKQGQAFAELVRTALRDGSFVEFCCFTIVRTSIGQVSGLLGSTLGAAVGTSLAPGPGTVVGAFLGRRLTIAVAKTISYKLTVELPMEVCLRKIRRYGMTVSRNPGDLEAASRLPRLEQFITTRLQREFDENVYETLDRLIGRVVAFDRQDLPAFVSLLRTVREMLSFKLLQKGDWYAAKKYHQMKLALEKVGLAKNVGF